MLESRFKLRLGDAGGPTFSYHIPFILKDGLGAVSSKQVTVRQRWNLFGSPQSLQIMQSLFSIKCKSKGLELTSYIQLACPPWPFMSPEVFEGLSALWPPAPISCSHQILRLWAASGLAVLFPQQGLVSHLNRSQSSVQDPPPAVKSCTQSPTRGLKLPNQ